MAKGKELCNCGGFLSGAVTLAEDIVDKTCTFLEFLNVGW